MVTIDEAIEIISHVPHQNTIVITDKGRQALQVGIEALRYCKRVRDGPYRNVLPPLLRETKE